MPAKKATASKKTVNNSSRATRVSKPTSSSPISAAEPLRMTDLLRKETESFGFGADEEMRIISLDLPELDRMNLKADHCAVAKLTGYFYRLFASRSLPNVFLILNLPSPAMLAKQFCCSELAVLMALRELSFSGLQYTAPRLYEPVSIRGLGHPNQADFPLSA